jgi:hypothetical protein
MAIQADTGTNDVTSLLRIRHQSVLAYGLDAIVPIVQEDIRRHNERVQDAVKKLCMPTQEPGKLYGTSVNGVAQKIDEYARGTARKVTAGGKVHWPLDKFTYGVGWTREWFEIKTPADLAIVLGAAKRAHLNSIWTEFRLAIFNPLNRTVRDTHDDKQPNYPLDVRALINGDGDPIPDGPNGEEFNPATHNHYLGLAAGYTQQQLAAKLKELIQTVVEHDHGDGVQLYISRANESEVTELPGFLKAQPNYVIQSITQDRIAVPLDTTKLDNRRIGYFEGAEVWTKPWVPANYYFAFAQNVTEENKPLAFRESRIETRRGMKPAAVLETHPLHAELMEWYLGIGANDRSNGATLFVGNATYQSPF